MKLTGKQIEQFSQALLSAFPTAAALTQLVAIELDAHLNAVVSVNGNLETWTYELIDWARSNGRLQDLLLGARARKGGNPELLAFFQALGLSAASAITQTKLESIVSTNSTLLNAGTWSAALGEREYQVGRVEAEGKARGTAFLVGPDLVLTNYHVVASLGQGEASGWAVRFDYLVARDGVTVSAGTLVPFAPGKDWLVDSSPFSPLDTTPLAQRGGNEPSDAYLDFALVRLSRKVGAEARRAEGGEERSWIVIPPALPTWGAVSGIAILQHPKGDPLKLALGLPETLTVNSTGTRVRYKTPTLPGSSGSPVFDMDWNLLAIHHSGEPELNPTFNEGIPIRLIASRPKVTAALTA